jgi:YD repeat-containing protein
MGAARAALAEKDRQSSTGRTGHTKRRGRTGQAERDTQSGIGWAGQAEGNRQRGTDRTGQAEQDRQNGTGRSEQRKLTGGGGAERDRQNWSGRTGQAEWRAEWDRPNDRKNGAGRRRQAEYDSQSRLVRMKWLNGTSRTEQPGHDSYEERGMQNGEKGQTGQVKLTGRTRYAEWDGQNRKGQSDTAGQAECVV